MSRTVLVTGATGFLGRHAVVALQHAGWKVRALCRSPSADLESLGATVVAGDVTDGASLDAALAGAAAVVHGAGLVSRDARDKQVMMEVHVQGTRAVVEAAARAGVDRVVHLSTSGTVAVGTDPSVVYHEEDPVPLGVIHAWPYYLSKYLAERAAADAVRLSGGQRPELVTLNPTLTLGPGDLRGSSTSDVRRYLDRQVPVVPSGGLSFVDVRDVADAVVAGLERGRDGERYLLSAMNLTFEDFFARLGEVSGVPGPAVPVKLPRRLTSWGVGLLERVAGAVGFEAPITRVEADMASHFWYCDARKAQEELGFAPRDPMKTLLDTVRDIRGERVEARTVPSLSAAASA